uniref:GRB10 n=1 Tax=Poeciliopsis prolifica TaxID=188132 RepID=A0A0S7EJJ5_9TELE
MALAGCPDYFLRHSNYQERMERTSSRRPEELIVSGFQRAASQASPHHHAASTDDDVDLEQLVNDMNSSVESVQSTQAETALLLNNGHMHTSHHQQAALLGHGQVHRRHTPPLRPSLSSREGLKHSQPMHIQAVRYLKEEQNLRPASLPAIPNPFPELCSPAGSPILSPIQTSDSHIVKIWSEDGAGKVVEIPADMTARDVCQLLVYKSHCVDDNAWTLVEHHPVLGLERCVEDHELVVQVQASMSSDSKFLFRKNYAKYEFFRNPLVSFSHP